MTATYYIAPATDVTDRYAAGYEGNRFDSHEEAEAAVESLAGAFPAGDPGNDASFWTVVEEDA